MGTDWVTWRISLARQEEKREEGRVARVLKHSKYGRAEPSKNSKKEWPLKRTTKKSRRRRRRTRKEWCPGIREKKVTG